MSRHHPIFDIFARQAQLKSIENKEHAAARWKWARRQHSEAQRHKSKHLKDPANGTNLGGAFEKPQVDTWWYMDHCGSIVDLLIWRYQYYQYYSNWWISWIVDPTKTTASGRMRPAHLQGAVVRSDHIEALWSKILKRGPGCVCPGQWDELLLEINSETLTIISFFDVEEIVKVKIWYCSFNCILVYFNGSIWILCLTISFQAGSRLCMLSQEIQIEAQELRVKEVWEAWPGKPAALHEIRIRINW